jgi:hypothetical protein
MPTILENYTAAKSSFDSSLRTAMPGPEQVWRHQEILYRIEVLEVSQMFVKTAPHSVDLSALCWHYQMVDAFFQTLTLERKYGPNADEHQLNQRDTAHANLLQVIGDVRKRFGSFKPENDIDYYQKTIKNAIQAVLCVWIQYRQTYTDINKEAV